MLKKILLLFLICSAAFAAEPVIKLDFEKPAETKKMPTVEGVSGKGILLTNQEFIIPSQGKVTPAEGTVTFWIKPDWDMNNTEFKFLLSAEDMKNQKGRMIIYKYRNPGLGMTFLFGAPGKAVTNFIYANKNDKNLIKKDQWNFICASWSTKSNLISVYVNGKLASSAHLKKSMHFEKFTDFKLNAKGFSPYNRKQKTVYDSIHFYNTELKEREIKHLYDRQMPRPKLKYANLKDFVMNIPLIKNPPKIDGNFVDLEWASCARMTGYTMAWQEHPALQSDMPTDLYIGTDGKTLYFCTVARLNKNSTIVTRPRERDGSVYSDDAMEVHLKPAKQDKTYQLIYNADTSIFDRIDNDTKWNGKWNIKSGIYEGLWISEVSMPLSEFKYTFNDGDEWGTNFCRDLQEPGNIVFSSLAPTNYLFKPSGVMRMNKNGIAPRFFINYNDLTKERKLTSTLEILNPSAKTLKINYSAEIFDTDNKLVRKTVNTATAEPSSVCKIPFNDKLSGISAAVVRICAETDGKIIFRQDIPLQFEDKIMLNTETNITQETLDIDVDCSRHMTAANAAKVTAQILDKNKKVVSECVLKGTSPAVGTLNLKGVPVGDYTISCTMFGKDGRELYNYQQNYNHIGQPEWLKRKSGVMPGVVPYPYTPLTWENNVLGVLNRNHTFKKSLLPASVTSLKRELMASEPQLTFTANGRKYTVDNFTFKLKKSAPDEMIFDFNAVKGDLNFKGTITAEYDGFIWYDLQLVPTKNSIAVDNLQLTLKFPRKIAEMFNAHFFARENRVGQVRDFIELKRFPSVWLGNLDVGYTFVTESFEFWRNRDENKTYTIVPDAKNVNFNINFIDRKTVISAAKPYKYGFGIEANPVKPTPKEFRSWRIFGHRPYNISHPWQVDRATKKHPGTGGFFDPTFKTKEGFLQNLENHKAKNALFSLYLNIFIASADSTEFKVFNKEWANPYNAYPNCPQSSFADYILWCVEKLVKDGLQCVYVDSLGAINCYNPAHGCGYIAEDGKTGLTYPVRAARNYMKRLYTLLHAPGRDQKNNFLWAHMSARTSAPINAFVDFQASGEEVEYRVMKESNYVRLYPLDEFQIYFLHSTGVVPCLLPNLGRIGNKKARYVDKYNDQIVMLTLLHDTLLWMLYCDEHKLVPFYNKLDQWGYKDLSLEFASYRTQKMITCSNPDIKVSVYRLKKENKALVIIGNIGEKENTFKLDIDKKALNLGSDLRFSDFRSKNSDSVNPEKITLPQFGLLIMEVKGK